MEFRSQENGTTMPISLGYNPSPIRSLAISKLTPFPSSSSSSSSPKEIQSTKNGLNPYSTPTTISSPDPTCPTGSNSTTKIKYTECLRNHAASVGGHVLDGCCEFMPSDAAPDDFKCAACGCHRSFHRKEAEGRLPNGLTGRIPRPLRLLLPLPQLQTHHYKQQFNYSGGSGGTTESSSEERVNPAAPSQAIGVAVSKKRFRTKFTAEQKERMMGVAERVGWRIHKQSEVVVEEFCAEVGIRRKVLKVWMHNNKHSIRKQQLQDQQQQQQDQQLQQ